MMPSAAEACKEGPVAGEGEALVREWVRRRLIEEEHFRWTI
jgi:hypothetical protein